MKKEKIPYIRFKKFEQNWFMICLNKISKSIEYGLNASAKDFDGIHKYLRITDIDDASRLFLTDKLSSPDINFTVGDYENYKLQKNDLLFARTGASVGKTYLYRKTDGEVYYAGFLIRARLRDSYDGNFVFQQTLTDKYKQFIEITSQRSGQPGVNGKEYGEWKIGMTSYTNNLPLALSFAPLTTFWRATRTTSPTTNHSRQPCSPKCYQKLDKQFLRFVWMDLKMSGESVTWVVFLNKYQIILNLL